MRHPVISYTDGACRGNPGPGGWGAVLQHGENLLELYGGETETTNNRMELTAAIKALDGMLVLLADMSLIEKSFWSQIPFFVHFFTNILQLTNMFRENIGEKIWKYDFWKDFNPVVPYLRASS